MCPFAGETQLSLKCECPVVRPYCTAESLLVLHETGEQKETIGTIWCEIPVLNTDDELCSSLKACLHAFLFIF